MNRQYADLGVFLFLLTNSWQRHTSCVTSVLPISDPEQKDVLEQRPDLATDALAVDMLDYTTVIPWQNAISDNAMTVTEAVALAQQSGLAEDCTGTNPHYGGGNITRADLHVYIVGANQLLPGAALTVRADARAREIVRLVNASSGKLITNYTGAISQRRQPSVPY